MYHIFLGTIGLIGRRSPSFFTHGRMMKTLVKTLQDTPFYVDKRTKKVFADFGNTFQVDKDGNLTTSPNHVLLVAMTLSKNPSFTCSDHMQWLGIVQNKSPYWYQSTAGVQAFPAFGALSSDEMEMISSHPLILIEVYEKIDPLWLISYVVPKRHAGEHVACTQT